MDNNHRSRKNICLKVKGDILTPSEVSTVLKRSSASSWTWATTPVELAFAPSAASTTFLGGALVGLLLWRQRTLALLFVLLQELGSFLLLQLHIGDL